MMKKNKFNQILAIIAILTAILATNVFAIDVGLSPSVTNFNNMLKGGYAEKTTTVSTSYLENVTGHIEVNGAIKSWLSFEPTNSTFTFSRNNPLRVKIIARPPSDVPNGDYTGTVSFVTDSVGSLTGSGTLIKAAVQLGVSTQIIGNEIIACKAGGFRINDVELGKPIGISTTILNEGNVRLTPTITVDIWDKEQKKMLMTKNILLDELLPTVERSYYQEFDANLERGQYWAYISVRDCQESILLTFNVLSAGEISDKGRLIEIIADRFVLTDTPMQIRARFENQGTRSVSAKFIGEARIGKKLVSAIESNIISVKPGETADLTIPFTPKNPGVHTITGRVLYNDKLSFEASTEFEAIGDAKTNTTKLVIYAAVYVLLLLLIMYLISKIKKGRKRHH